MAKRRRRKRLVTPEQLKKKEEKAHIKGLRRLFEGLGFTRIDTDGVEISFDGRAGELDDIFVLKNVVVIAEYTVGKPDSAHLFKKKVLYDKIIAKPAEFIAYARTKYGSFGSVIDPLYSSPTLKVKIVYASKQDPSSEVIANCESYRFIHGSTARYFESLSKTIGKSAQFEFLKFLQFSFEEFGEPAVRTIRRMATYDGFLLPEAQSSYPQGFKVVSFYADPETLMGMSYVLRRDGWRDGAHLYQRVLVPKKIRKMRKYLVDESRVFVNNVIVTLPTETQLNAPSGGRNLPSQELDKAKPVTIAIPQSFENIGIVDGQHRVFCYHEGTDSAESKISLLRTRQHLLVTGLIYPPSWPIERRNAFEAKLFLEINDNQTRTRSALRQDIEVIISPESPTAIAKRVVQELGRHGIYKGMLQTSYFDSPNKLKTSSIVSYGLRPLVKLDGDDSLSSIWPKAKQLKKASGVKQRALIEEYVKFCADKLNEFLLPVKLACVTQGWDVEAQPRSALLSPTAINGLIVTLRLIIQSGYSLSGHSHQKHLRDVASFDFRRFKSSQWKSLGTSFFEGHYRKSESVS